MNVISLGAQIAEQAAKEKQAALAQEAALVQQEETPLVHVADTVVITPRDLNVETPALPSHLLVLHIARILCKYARFRRIEDVISLALWIASTWFVEPTSAQGMLNGTLLFEAHLRVLLIGDPESGKNRVMKIMRKLVRNPSIIGTGKVTAVGVRNLLNHGKTVFIDDLHDRLGMTGRRNSDLKDELLAYSREAGSIDGAEGKDNERDLFGPIVMASQPQILKGMQGDALTDLFQRCLIITLHPAADVVPRLDEEFETDCENIRKALELWGAALYETSMRGRKGARYTPVHTMPTEFRGRRLECAEVLCAVADRAVNPEKIAAEGSDTEWAEQARAACKLLLLSRGDVSQVAATLKAEFDQGMSLSDALGMIRE